LYRSEFLFKDALQELETLGDTKELIHLRRFLLLSQMPGRRGLIPGKGKPSVTDES
jgi:UDP-N-acetylglucosamine acyltransferase